ncbi:MAG: NifB/NifX family molybdenum-iron cluster-binding protein [Pyrobaculum sp.]
MRIVVPLDENKGWDSKISEELGHAPYFAVVDGDSLVVVEGNRVITGRGPRWAELYTKLKPDVLITREIGKPAYAALKEKNVRIYYADAKTLREAVERLKKGELKEFPEELAHEPHHSH